ncbi:MAG: type II toxin-antitoxin system VapC family toxin [Steroidobacteraceae bacterium]
MSFVLDASVALAWLLPVPATRDAVAASAALEQLRAPSAIAHVPTVWTLEVSNVLARCELQGVITQAQSEAYLALLRQLPLRVDSAPGISALPAVLQMARRYRLSSYDASYLDLALRLSLPLMTLDRDLRKAADRAGVG